MGVLSNKSITRRRYNSYGYRTDTQFPTPWKERETEEVRMLKIENKRLTEAVGKLLAEKRSLEIDLDLLIRIFSSVE